MKTIFSEGNISITGYIAGTVVGGVCCYYYAKSSHYTSLRDTYFLTVSILANGLLGEAVGYSLGLY